MKRLRLTAALLGALLLVSLAGCSLVERFMGGAGEQEALAGPDEDQEEIDPEYPVSAGGATVAARPGKVVSLAPSLTEKLFDLGMDDRLVGISDYCDYPGWVADLTPCGTAQIPDLEVIALLEPHLVLSEAELPDDAMEALDALGIPVAVFPRADTVLDLLYNYEDIARLMEGETAGLLIGGAVADEFEAQLHRMQSVLAPYTEREGRKSALYLRFLDFTVATGDTFENELLQYICLDNVAADYSEWTYPAEAARSAEGLAAFAGIDIIFMDESAVTITDLEQSEFYKGLPATIQDRYLYISSIAMERQSMRTIAVLAEMAAYAYEEAVPPGGFGLAAAADQSAQDSDEEWDDSWDQGDDPFEFNGYDWDEDEQSND